MLYVITLLALWLAVAPVSWQLDILSFDVVRVSKHNKNDYTQGLEFIDNKTLLESTGLKGKSRILTYNYNTKKEALSVPLKSSEFGEGATQLPDGSIHQLTFKPPTIIEYNEQLKRQRTTPLLKTLKEGWGLTHQGDLLVATDSTQTIRWLDPSKDYSVVKEVDAVVGDWNLVQLNELELVGNTLWANVWLTDCLLNLAVNTGELTGILDLTEVADKVREKYSINPFSGDVLNGIAAVPGKKDTFVVTGKRWPEMFEIKVSVKETVSDDLLCVAQNLECVLGLRKKCFALAKARGLNVKQVQRVANLLSTCGSLRLREAPGGGKRMRGQGKGEGKRMREAGRGEGKGRGRGAKGGKGRKRNKGKGQRRNLND